MTTTATTTAVLPPEEFQLRAHAGAVPRLWHITRTHDDLALCGKHLPDPAATRPITHLDGIAGDRHCRMCWPSYRTLLHPATA